MKSVFVRLSTIEAIRDFVSTVLTFDYDIDLRSGRYLIDAKSIMGIFSLDLLNPVTLTAHSDDCDELMAKLDKFILK